MQQQSRAVGFENLEDRGCDRSACWSFTGALVSAVVRSYGVSLASVLPRGGTPEVSHENKQRVTYLSSSATKVTNAASVCRDVQLSGHGLPVLGSSIRLETIKGYLLLKRTRRDRASAHRE